MVIRMNVIFFASIKNVKCKGINFFLHFLRSYIEGEFGLIVKREWIYRGK